MSHPIRVGQLLALTLATACSPSQSSSGLPDSVTPTVESALASVGPAAVQPTVERSLLSAALLRDRVGEWAAAIQAGADGLPEREAAQDAFVQASMDWQQVELMQLGPAAPSPSVGGLGLRDQVYSWPTSSPCEVDKMLLDGGWSGSDFPQAGLVYHYGLDALERLLYASADTLCDDPVVLEQWSAGSFTADRAEYALAVADDVAARSTELAAGWSANGADFGNTLAASGQPGADFSTREQGLGAVYDALYYVDSHVKHRKLKRPLGLEECASAPCPELVEDRGSGLSAQWIGANIAGFRLLFTGGDAAGLDDVLVDLGYGDLADQILAAADTAQATAQGVQMPLAELILSDPDAATALYHDVEALTDLVEGDLATVLTLTVPTESGADAD